MCAELCTYGGTVALTCTLAHRIEKLSFSFALLAASTAASVKHLCHKSIPRYNLADATTLTNV